MLVFWIKFVLFIAFALFGTYVGSNPALRNGKFENYFSMATLLTLIVGAILIVLGWLGLVNLPLAAYGFYYLLIAALGYWVGALFGISR